jgi:hypothetical protein
MFNKSTIMGSVTLALLTNEVKAVKYRPLVGTTPWYKKASVGENEDPKYPYNYYIPNFGVDYEIETSQRHLSEAEQDIGTEMKASFKRPKGYPVDYKVPSYGQDGEIKQALNNIAQSETNLKHKWTPPTKEQLKAAAFKKDYFIPNFGVDHDVKTSLANESNAEKSIGHKWTPASRAEIKAATFKKDYFIPNFGIDSDIKETQKNILNTEKIQKHTWKPVRDENGVFIVPEVNRPAAFTAVQTDASLETESDPICTSAGCNYRKNRGKTAHPLDYFVPNFGQDETINTSFDSLDWA